jgi:hypothetical protein
MSYIPDVTEKSINIDTEVSEKLETGFLITDFLGCGGGSIVVKAKITEKNDEIGLYTGVEIAIKLCNPYMSLIGCNEMKKEIINTQSFSSLNYKKICYNYPITYGFFHRCIFFEKEEVNFIIKYMEENEIKEGKDAFIIYCTTPSNLSINDNIIKYLTEEYKDNDFLIKSKNILPKSNNSYGLYILSKLSDKDNEDIDWKNQTLLYDYLEMLQDLKCDMFIAMQYLNGKDLSQLSSDYYNKNFKYKLTDTLFFECLYSIFCPIKTLGITPIDIQPSNVMIVNTDNPRIYLYKETYYVITGKMFYFIDFQGLQYTNSIEKSMIKFFSFFTEEQKRLVDDIFSKEFISIEILLDKLFLWLKTKKDNIDNIEIMTRKEAEVYMIKNYNYKIVLVDKLI